MTSPRAGLLAPRPPLCARSAQPRADVELFTREGCPRCDEAKRFLIELEGQRPGLRALVADVVEDRAALDRLRAIAEQQSTAADGEKSSSGFKGTRGGA
ncbi:MAG TPA: hypothetical protein VL242_00415 [Sorangium sp.]|nr:hypothetical protein [Sorangium sp.]